MVAWIERHGSGTLKNSVKEGLMYEEHYRHEFVAWTYGAGFHAYPKNSGLVHGEADSLPDCPAVTETCWYARRLRAMYAEREMNVSITVRAFNFHDKEADRYGMGLLVVDHSDPRLSDYDIFAITTLRSDNGEWSEVENPC